MVLVTFIRLFSIIIKNHTKVVHDLGSGDISHKCHYRLFTIVTIKYVTKAK